MTNGTPNNSFSWGDALFLYIERPGQPLSIAGVSIFDGKISLKDCRELVASKLPLVPRYRQRVAFQPLNLGLPHWEFDPNFDIRNHIRQVTLRGGTERELKALASKIVSTHLDRHKPLWDITLVQGLDGKRTGMIVRLHHCLADGISGVGIINVLMDTSPKPQRVQPQKAETPPEARRDPGAALLDGLLKSYSSAVKGAFMLQSEAMSLARNVLGASGEPFSDLLEIVPEVASPAERLPFNVVCHGPQKFGWTEISMADVKVIRERCGGTVNDVILTVVAAALRRYSELRGVRVKGRSARIMIPVNVRGNGDVGELGNRISFCPVTVPLDIRDPQKLFAYVRQRTEYLKRAHAAEVVGFVGGLLSAIPPSVWAAVGPLVSQLPLSFCNIICTNIPGPQVPLYLLGRKMLSWYPYVPIGGEMGFNCAILSYDGKAYFGFTCDVAAVPDPESLEKFVDQSFAELSKSAEQVSAQTKADEPKQHPQTVVSKGVTPRKVTNRTIPPSTPGAKPKPVAAKRRVSTGKAAATSPKRIKPARIVRTAPGVASLVPDPETSHEPLAKAVGA